MDTSRFTRFGDNEKKMVQAGIDAVTRTEMWPWMAAYEPEEGNGFMFSTHPNLDKINSVMHKLYDGHSGSSYGWTMRQLQFIAKNGFDAYVDKVNGVSKTSTRACACRSREGFTEGWCGVAGGGVPGCEH